MDGLGCRVFPGRACRAEREPFGPTSRLEPQPRERSFGLAQSIPLQVEALGTVRLRDPRVADQHWRLQNDRFCDA